MRKTFQRIPRFVFRLAWGWLFLLLCAACVPFARAQRADSLAQARSLYVQTFQGGPAAAELRERLIRKLAGSRRFRIVPSPAEADAVLQGTGQVWVRGFISTNVRTPSSDRRAVYSGYLSLEVVGHNNQPLWSWLATPSRLAWTDIVDDLADHVAKKMLEAAKSSRFATQPSSATLAQTNLAGAGATFPAPLYQKWFEDFGELHPGVRIHYSTIGSQLGVEKLLAGDLDFAGSDVAPSVIAGDAATAHLRRIASVLGGVVPIYNLPGVTVDLRFTPEVLADIYLGRIKRWDDPEIRRDNRGVNLPDANIVVVHRADGSGTSWVWSDFLSKVSPYWASTVGRGTLLHWPVGMGAVHNEGVAEAVGKTPDSIGYVELAYAIQRQLSYGSVRNRAGEFIHASLDSLAEAASASHITGAPPPSITNPAGKYAYPIAAFTWLVLPARTDGTAQSAALLELLRWVLTSGQKECSALGYVPLPRETADSELQLVSTH